MQSTNPTFKSFKAFYPYYLKEHRNVTCRRLHFIGSTLVLAVIAIALLKQHYSLLWLLPVIGYGFAWVAHFFVEHNKPATFKYPLYSFVGDHKMYVEILAGKHKIF